MWRNEKLGKENLGIKPSNFLKIINISVYNFRDASEIGYGWCSYLRVVDENQNMHCSLIMRKARVAPKTFVSIPKLELAAAVLTVKIPNMIKKEFKLSGQTAGLCWGTLLMIQEHSRTLLLTECTWYKKIAMLNRESMSHHRTIILQMMFPEVWILNILLILIDGFWVKNSCGSHSHHGRQIQFQYYYNQKIQNGRNKSK